MQISESQEGSLALQLVTSQGWNYRVASEPNIEVENCPYCKHGNYHLRMSIHGSADPQKNRDGLHSCMRCGKGGNLYSLKQHLGLVVPGLESRKDFAANERKQEPLPDTDLAHERLMEDAEALDYLQNIRGFSREIIQRMKIGVIPKRWFRECGEVKALVYPYLVGANTVFAHYRTLPPAIKAFSSPMGWPVPLYNGEVLNDPSLKEIILVEGEPDCITGLDHGIENICGVPGANFKKAEWIDQLDKLERVYICYDKDSVGQKAAQELANRIGIEKCWKIVLPDFSVPADNGEVKQGKDLNEYFTLGGFTSEDFQRLKDEATLFDVAGVASSQDSVQEFLDELNDKQGVEPKYKTQWPTLNTLVGFDPGDVVDILAPEKIGKFLSVDTKILMSDGTWQRNGDMKVGDSIASIDGKENIVTGVFPQGIQPMLKCTFADGRSVLAGKPHLWKIDSVNKWEGGPRISTTDMIQQHHSSGHHSGKVYIPLCSGDFGTANLPLDPWVVGALIGDGGISNGSPGFTTTDEELVRLLQERVSQYGDVVNAIGEHREAWKNGHIKASSKTVKQFGIRSGEGQRNYTTEALRSLGMSNCIANTKFIPKIYLEADKESRWELLRGLMDTDGTAGNKSGTPSYCTVSRQLAEDFVYLVRSLGGLAKIGKPQKKSFRYKGQMHIGQDAYIIVVRFPATVRKNVFSLERKKKLINLKEKNHDPRLTFDKIEYAGEHEAVCISVSHPSKLYITDDFIVTHNTTFAMNMMEHMVNSYGEDGVFICLEMTRARMARKWIAHKAEIADNIPKNADEALALKVQFETAIPIIQKEVAEREGDFYFCYPKYKTVDDIYSLMRDCIRRYGVKWIAIDNIQRLCDTTLGDKGRTQHLSEISKTISQIAKDYGVQVIRILQPHRIAAGKIATSDNVDGASQIGKDCDAMIILHRERLGDISADDVKNTGFIYEEAAFGEDMLTTVGLSRYSGGGRTTLHYNGATSTVLEKNEGQIAKMRANANKGIGYENINKALRIATGKEPDTIKDEVLSV